MNCLPFVIDLPSLDLKRPPTPAVRSRIASFDLTNFLLDLAGCHFAETFGF
jgi:hypothetical protein